MSEQSDARSTALSGVTAYSPWGSRSATPKPKDQPEKDGLGSESRRVSQRQGGDHAISHRHKLSLKSYPKDCPKLLVQWYHAVDSPKRKLLPSGQEPSNAPPLPPPKKYVPFSETDSRAIEAAFQKLAEEEEAIKPHELVDEEGFIVPPNTALKGKVKVPVNEDYLFDVDVENRELGPAYWLGPVYNVRRGTWFYSVGSGLSPCDENLATQLEEGYLKIQPWAFPIEEQMRSRASSQNRSRPTSLKLEGDAKPVNTIPNVPSSGGTSPNLKPLDTISQQGRDRSPSQSLTKTFRLFGAHMNSMVTYQDATTAWLLTDDFMSRMSSNMYERFAGGGHFAGVKLVRGFVDTKKTDAKKEKLDGPSKDTAVQVKDPTQDQSESTSTTDVVSVAVSAAEKRRQRLERQMSAVLLEPAPDGLEKQEEEARKRDEEEMEDGYTNDDDSQGREIEHLILVTHGIGQRLGLRIESINFVHDVNTMRKTLKDIYTESPDLQALNGDIGKDKKNSRIQVLPVCWRHLLDFPKQSLKHNREEHDLGDVDHEEDDDYPSLEDINVEGVPAVRNLITDLALDILLYQSPAYKNHITRIVLEESNRVYALFKQRNPSFNGRISLVGHSLGSAIMFDILCKQPGPGMKPRGSTAKTHKKHGKDAFKLDFPVEDFYALGSPIGLFQMLKGRTIAARTHSPADAALTAETPNDEGDLGGDPFSANTASSSGKARRTSLVDITTSSPSCLQMYNIFHPTDPIAYRLEPLISSAMAPLKPQPLPYTKKGIFGTPVGQGLTGIGARVGQSVSGLWTSLSSGIASSLLNRSLGLSADQQGQLGNQIPQDQKQPRGQPTANTLNPELADPAMLNDERKRRLAQDNIMPGEDGKHPPTLIDAEMETLYSGFQRHLDGEDESGEAGVLGVGRGKTLEEQARRLKKEEAKVRALNSNGRVDYSIQEGAFDISLLASIASHLSYWGDEDVAHFMASQLLARHRVLKRRDHSGSVSQVPPAPAAKIITPQRPASKRPTPQPLSPQAATFSTAAHPRSPLRETFGIADDD